MSFDQDEDDQYGQGYVGSFPKDFGYGAFEQDGEGSGGPLSGERKPRILLMGLRRMSSLNLIAKFSNCNTCNAFAPQISLVDLEIGKVYKARGFKVVHSTKYGRSIVVQLHVPEKAGEDGDDLRECFLPRRFVPIFSDTEIARYNQSPDLGIIFRGLGKRREYLVEMVEDWS